MQQIINFLIRYKNFLLFVFLLCISLVFTVQSHSYHRSKFVNSANFLSGGVYESVNGITEYFRLKSHNQELVKENARLRQKLGLLGDVPYEVSKDTLGLAFVEDTLGQYRYIPAKVLNNSYARTDNFLTLKIGKRDSVKHDMGVISSKGIIGFVDKVSTKYSTVLSILNTAFLTNAQLQSTNHSGTLKWDGKDPNVMQLVDVQQQAPVKVGDTIVTSGKSAIFPRGIPVGTIESFFLDDSKNFYTIAVRLINDMTDIGYVYIIENRDLKEIQTLEITTDNEE